MTGGAEDHTSLLFAQAMALVKSHLLAPAEREPAFVVTPPAAGTPAAGPPVATTEGASPEVVGLEGDAWDVAERIRGGRSTVAQVVAGAMAQIAAHDERLGGFAHVASPDSVAEQVAALAAHVHDGAPIGPLHGVPVSVKDIIHVQGMPTAAGSVARPPVHPARDATAIARVRAAGAVLVGKTETHEFALGVTTPQSRSPWDEERVPGGSSGGSAISVVTGMALASVGTDTRASIRVPAALTGTVGFKPTSGIVARDGWVPLSWSLDQLAPLTRSVRDVALLLDVMAASGHRFRSALPGNLEGLRLAWSDALVADADLGVVEVFEAALDRIAAGGGKPMHQAWPTEDDLDLANAVGMVVSRTEAASAHVDAGTDLSRCTPEVRGQLEAAMGVRGVDYVRALRLRGQLRERMEAALDHADLLVMPTCKVVAPLRSEASGYLLLLSQNCIPWSLVDFPALSLPAGEVAGLPIGIQLVARTGEDELVLSVAHALEQLLAPPPAWVSSASRQRRDAEATRAGNDLATSGP